MSEASPTAQAACCPSPRTAGTKPSMRSMLELADLAKAIGHPARVQILRLLIEKNTCVAGDIFQKLPLAQSTVSQHLKVLREAGLIIGCEDGPRVCYCVESEVLARFKELVSGF
jgi:DNA-binding transcriptional ArsR family regulator